MRVRDWIKEKWLAIPMLVLYNAVPYTIYLPKHLYSDAVGLSIVCFIASVLCMVAGYQNWKQILLECQKCQKDFEIEQAKITYNKLKQKHPENEITIIGSEEDIKIIKGDK